MKKKVLAVILGAVMVASMAGCGGSDTEDHRYSSNRNDRQHR